MSLPSLLPWLQVHVMTYQVEFTQSSSVKGGYFCCTNVTALLRENGIQSHMLEGPLDCISGWIVWRFFSTDRGQRHIQRRLCSKTLRDPVMKSFSHQTWNEEIRQAFQDAGLCQYNIQKDQKNNFHKEMPQGNDSRYFDRNIFQSCTLFILFFVTPHKIHILISVY